MTAHALPTTVDSIKNSLVALRMPRALEVLDATLRRIEQGQIDGIEALDQLLVKKLSLRENRRIKVALSLARPATIKTLPASTSPSSRRSTGSAFWRSPN